MDLSRSRHNNLRMATGWYIAAFIVHNADHARRGVDATPEPVVWAGTAVAMITAVVATLVFTDHPIAARFAAIGGAAISIGVAISHLTPIATPLTDPLTVEGISALSWIAVLGEITTAMVLALVGLRLLRSEQSSGPVSHGGFRR